MNNKDDMYVNMEHVIGEMAFEYGVPILRFEQLTELGKRAVTVYGLHDQATKITFSEICEYIQAFIKTPFGARQLEELSKL